MHGTSGLRGWQWIFILESIPTMVVANFFFFIPKNLKHAKFLSNVEISIINKKLHQNAEKSKLSNDLIKKQILSVFTDYKIYIYTMIMTITMIVTSSAIIFTPVIINDLGFDPVTSQALSAPPLIIATIGVFITAWLSNRKRERGFHIVGAELLTIIGIIGLIIVEPTKQNTLTRYILICIMITGALSYLPVFSTWFISNIG
jgi:cyanate permease